MNYAVAVPANNEQRLDHWIGPGPCHDCGLGTVQWRPARRGRWLEHAGGKPGCRFPCRRRCQHIDCAEARGASARPAL